jgi:tetratricopeptide (TPR) repeat protein
MPHDASTESADERRIQLARSLGLQGRFDDAWAELARISVPRTPRVEIRIQLEQGRLENSRGRRDDARPYFQNALELAEQGHFDDEAIDAAHMLGIVSDGEESIRWHELGLQLAAASSSSRARNWRGTLLNNLGWTYVNIGDFETALSTFQSALAFHETTGDAVRIRVAQWTVARCLRALKRYDEALAIHHRLIEYPEQGYVSEELGELLLVLGRPDEARAHFTRAYELLTPRLGPEPSQSARLERLKELGQ